MQELTHDELAAARANEDWATLWRAAVPVVEAVVTGMRRRQDLFNVDWEDLEQDAHLAMNDAVRQWDPLQSPFRTWVGVCAKNRVRNSAKFALLKDTKLARDVDVAELPSVKPVFDFNEEQIENLLLRLKPYERKLIALAYGIGCAEMSIQEIAVAYDVSSATVYRMVGECLAKMREA